MNAVPFPDEQPDRRGRIGKALRVLVPFAILALLALLIWKLASDTTGAKRQMPEPPMIALAPPPPPPPPPKPEEKPPEPQKAIETPAPTPTPTPKPQTPSPDKTVGAPKDLTEAGPPTAGSDAFGLKAGSGGGTVVGGDPDGDGGGAGDFGAANYGSYLKSALQDVVNADDRVNKRVFAARVLVWISPAGAITRVELAQSSGDADADRALIAALNHVGRLDRPPAQLGFPARIALRGRRS